MKTRKIIDVHPEFQSIRDRELTKRERFAVHRISTALIGFRKAERCQILATVCAADEAIVFEP